MNFTIPESNRSRTFARFMATLDISNLPVFEMVPFSCVVPEQDYFDTLLWTTRLPILVAVMLGLIPCFFPAQRHRPWNLFLVMTFVVLPICTSMILNVWICKTFTVEDQPLVEERYLLVDLSMNCESSRYYAMQGYAIIMTFIYPVGIPLFYCTLLFRSRHEVYPGLKEHGAWSTLSHHHPSWQAAADAGAPEPSHPLNFLVHPYKPR